MRTLFAIAFLLATIARADAASGQLEIVVEGLRSNDGRLVCQLYSSADGFPTDPSKALVKTTALIADKRGRCLFTDVRPGTLAVAIFHDENDNGRLDTNFLGIPREGLASSRDAKGFFGPPKFVYASFPYVGAFLSLVAHVRYL